MHCSKLKLPDGGVAIVCSSGRSRIHACVGCGQVAGFQCDWKTGKGTTCDAWICADHAQEVAPDKHLCPAHQVSYKQWLERRASRSEPSGSTI